MNEILMRIKLENHLQYNFYPPVSLQMADYCIKAINHAKVGEWDALVEFPDNSKMRAGDMIEDLHLEYFVESAEGE